MFKISLIILALALIGLVGTTTHYAFANNDMPSGGGAGPDTTQSNSAAGAAAPAAETEHGSKWWNNNGWQQDHPEWTVADWHHHHNMWVTEQYHRHHPYWWQNGDPTWYPKSSSDRYYTNRGPEGHMWPLNNRGVFDPMREMPANAGPFDLFGYNNEHSK